MAKSRENRLKISAIVLRFRDKGENVTDTIAEHMKFIQTKQQVWWGWWAKEYEFPPVEYLEEIEHQLHTSSPNLKIFLLNTKRDDIVYQADCAEIHYSSDSTNVSIPSPDPESTPAYYKNVAAKLWLKFTNITKYDKDELINNKYSFLPDPASLFQPNRKENHLFTSFANCKVSKLAEFTVQRRTIWFLRSQQKNDAATNLDSWLPLPSNFAKHHTHARQNANKVLVLSDLHFTKEATSDGKKRHVFSLSDDDNETRLTLLQSLEAVIKCPEIGGFDQLAGIVIAGDFVFKPTAEEFELAKDFIKKLLDMSGLKPDQLALVPGNHDIAFIKEEPKPEGDRIPPFASVQARQNFREFYEQIYNTAPNDYLCSCRKIKLSNELQIQIICINSSVLQQEEDSFVQGYVSERQWDIVKNELNMHPDIQTYAYRILLLHHHLLSTSIYSELPEQKKNYNILLDAGRVSYNIRRYNIKLVIHGHGHESGYEHSAPRKKQSENRAPNPYDVISMGSAGSSDIPPGEHNSFGILDFSQFGKVVYSKYKLPTTHREQAAADKDKTLGKAQECWEIPIYPKEE